MIINKKNLIVTTIIFLIVNSGDICGKIPNFRIGLIDSTYYTATNIHRGSPVLFYYYSSSCDDCKDLTSTIIKNIEELKNIQIIMITNESLIEVKKYVDKYNLQNYSNIIIGTEGLSGRFLQNFQVTKLPFLLYMLDTNKEEKYIFKENIGGFMQIITNKKL